MLILINNVWCAAVLIVSYVNHFCSLSFYVFRVSNLDELEYRRVVLHGFFDHGIEFYIRPRQLLSGETRQRIQTSEPGAQVITPFYCRQTKSVRVSRNLK